MYRTKKKRTEDPGQEVVFATFQPGRLRKWSRAEMLRLSAEDIRAMLDSRRAVVLQEFECAEGARFRP
jgi:hypothetical protein